MANTAPATCVPLDLFGVFERKLWDSKLQKQENRVEMKCLVCLQFKSINLKQLLALCQFSFVPVL